MTNVHHTICQRARVNTSTRWAEHEYIPICNHGQVLFADIDFTPDFLLCPTSFIPPFHRSPSFVPPRSSRPLPPLPPASPSQAVHHLISMHGTFIHPDVSPNVRTQRAQALGVQTPSAHASSLSRTAQNQTVRPSFPNACKARTIPREMTPVERREQESGEHVT